jgi:hypothetical protein
VGGEIEIEAENEDGKEDVTRPQPETQRPRALESTTSDRLVVHLTRAGQSGTYIYVL